MVFLMQCREPGTSQADENASVALAGETDLMLQRCLKGCVCLSVCLFKVLIPAVGPWFFPCVSHNDNPACPGEAQLVGMKLNTWKSP